jgi:protein gp37
MAASAIEWTDEVWNPVTGCDRVSPGCAHCYALELAPRLRAMGIAKYQRARDGGKSSGPAFGVTLHEDVLDQPLRWRRPRRVFVNSMSDLFHEEVPDLFIKRVWDVMEQSPEHTYQVLTKRPERMRAWVTAWLDRALDYAHRCETSERVEMRTSPAAIDARARARPLPNVWLGVSIENRRYFDRADLLRETPAAVRFISAEPLLGRLVRSIERCPKRRAGDGQQCIRPHEHPGDCSLTWGSTTADFGEWPAELDLGGIDWLIVGGESGPKHRPIREDWVRSLRDAAGRTDTAFFFKQWGGRTPKAGGRELDGRTWDEFPPTVAVPS